MTMEKAKHGRVYCRRVASDSADAIKRQHAQLISMSVDGLGGCSVSRDVNDPENLATITIWHNLDQRHTREASQAYRQLYPAAVPLDIIGFRVVSPCEVRVAQEHVKRRSAA